MSILIMDVSNKIVTGFKEKQETDDMAGQYLWAGNYMITNPRMMFQLNGVVG